jgi:hypothetical protein
MPSGSGTVGTVTADKSYEKDLFGRYFSCQRIMGGVSGKVGNGDFRTIHASVHAGRNSGVLDRRVIDRIWRALGTF